MTLRSEAGVTYTQTWDVDNRLTQAQQNSGTTQFTYDADGRRVMQTLPDGTKIVYVGGIEVSITGTTRITKTYYAAGAKLVAMRVITSTGSALYYLHSDHLGSVSLTTDGTGAVVSEQKYTAWGVVWSATGAGQTDIGFTGQRADASTGLIHFQARYYSVALARFVSADSIVPGAGNPQALNRFSYVLGNPLNYTDPSGHDPDWVERWNNAHGRCKEGSGYVDCEPYFWDQQIFEEVGLKWILDGKANFSVSDMQRFAAQSKVSWEKFYTKLLVAFMAVGEMNVFCDPQYCREAFADVMQVVRNRYEAKWAGTLAEVVVSGCNDTTGECGQFNALKRWAAGDIAPLSLFPTSATNSATARTIRAQLWRAFQVAEEVFYLPVDKGRYYNEKLGGLFFFGSGAGGAANCGMSRTCYSPPYSPSPSGYTKYFYDLAKPE